MTQHSVRVVRTRPWIGVQQIALECGTKGCDWEHEFTTDILWFEELAAIAEAHEQNPALTIPDDFPAGSAW